MPPLPGEVYDPEIHEDVFVYGSAFTFSPLDLVGYDPDLVAYDADLAATMVESLYSTRRQIRDRRNPDLPALTGDGRDGFTTRAQLDRAVQRYLDALSDKKKGKALISEWLYDRVFEVLLAPYNHQLEDAQFRWWVRKTFTLQITEDNIAAIHHDAKPVVCREQLYDTLVAAHGRCDHGGRDKTAAVVREFYSWVPKEITARFVALCPGCTAWERRDDRYFAGKNDERHYPVHHEIRALSIAAGHADEQTYSNIDQHQPPLPAGMSHTPRRARRRSPSLPSVPPTGEASSSSAQHQGSGRVRRTPVRAPRRGPYPRSSASQIPARSSDADAARQSFPPFPESSHYPVAGLPPNHVLAQAASFATAGIPPSTVPVPGANLTPAYAIDPASGALLHPDALSANVYPTIAGAVPTHFGFHPVQTFGTVNHDPFSMAANADPASTGAFSTAAVPVLDGTMANASTAPTVIPSMQPLVDGQQMVVTAPSTLPTPAPATVPVPGPASVMPSPIHGTAGWMQRPVELTDAALGHFRIPLNGAGGQTVAQTPTEDKLMSEIMAAHGHPADGQHQAVQQTPVLVQGGTPMVQQTPVLVQGGTPMLATPVEDPVLYVSPSNSHRSGADSSSPSRSSSRRPSSEIGLGITVGVEGVSAGGEDMMPDLSWASSTTNADGGDRSGPSSSAARDRNGAVASFGHKDEDKPSGSHYPIAFSPMMGARAVVGGSTDGQDFFNDHHTLDFFHRGDAVGSPIVATWEAPEGTLKVKEERSPAEDEAMASA